MCLFPSQDSEKRDGLQVPDTHKVTWSLAPSQTV